MIRCVVVDDQALIREGLTAIIEQDPEIQVVGCAGDGEAALKLIACKRPDVAIMDIRMPRLDGIRATQHITVDPALCTKVLVLTTFDLDEYVVAAVRAGASAFMLKDDPPESFRTAIHRVAAGDALLSPDRTRMLIDRFVRRPESTQGRSKLEQLTVREREVLTLIGRGLNNTELGAELGVRESTVKTHVNRVLAKLELRDRIQAVIFAYENGLVGRE